VGPFGSEVTKFSVDGSGNVTISGTFTGNGSGLTNVSAATLNGQAAGSFATLGANNFTGNQSVTGNINLSGSLSLPATTNASTGVINLGGTAFMHDCCPNSTQNTFVGTSAGNFTADATGSSSGNGQNTATGFQALQALTSGYQNTANGGNALHSNTTGNSNTASGFYALQDTTTGSNNTAIGTFALYFNTTGSYNTASGNQALLRNTTGSYNTASGNYALVSNTTGASNIADGNSALYSNTTGNANTASGTSALVSNDTGGSNSAFGNCALWNTFGTSAGALTGFCPSSLSLPPLTAGSNDTAIGSFAGRTNTTGQLNTFLGWAADASSGGLTNATAVGAYAVVGQSNALVLGSINGVNGATASVNVGIGTTQPANILTVQQSSTTDPIADAWTVYSSRRWKTNIRTIGDALEKVQRLRGVYYDAKADGQPNIGVIAEEVGEVLPEVVAFEANGQDAKSVDYARLTALLIEAVKEQQAEIRELKAHVERLTAELAGRFEVAQK